MQKVAYDYTFGIDLPELKELIDTQHFKRSEELMDLRFELGFSEEQMANLLKVSLQDYLLMEFGTETICVKRCEQVISNVKEYVETIKNEKTN